MSPMLPQAATKTTIPSTLIASKLAHTGDAKTSSSAAPPTISSAEKRAAVANESGSDPKSAKAACNRSAQQRTRRAAADVRLGLDSFGQCGPGRSSIRGKRR